MTLDHTSSARIRPLAICVFHHANRILVNEAYDKVRKQRFFRPLGGGIEFGETSADAVRRELREELGLEVAELRLLGTLENIFVCEGKPGHEIVQVYDGAFADRTTYERPFLEGYESDQQRFRASWQARASFCDSTPLYPDGLLHLLEANGLLLSTVRLT